MITQENGNLLAADVEALVNTVNCKGIMGKGVALQFKEAYPKYYEKYRVECETGKFQPGMVWPYETQQLLNPRYIINFATKGHWKGNSKLEYIYRGLPTLVDLVKQKQIKSIAIPALGCGYGGLNWNEVRPLIEQAFVDLPDVEVKLYAPHR